MSFWKKSKVTGEPADNRSGIKNTLRGFSRTAQDIGDRAAEFGIRARPLAGPDAPLDEQIESVKKMFAELSRDLELRESAALGEERKRISRYLRRVTVIRQQYESLTEITKKLDSLHDR